MSVRRNAEGNWTPWERGTIIQHFSLEGHVRKLMLCLPKLKEYADKAQLQLKLPFHIYQVETGPEPSQVQAYMPFLGELRDGVIYNPSDDPDLWLKRVSLYVCVWCSNPLQLPSLTIMPLAQPNVYARGPSAATFPLYKTMWLDARRTVSQPDVHERTPNRLAFPSYKKLWFSAHIIVSQLIKSYLTPLIMPLLQTNVNEPIQYVIPNKGPFKGSWICVEVDDILPYTLEHRKQILWDFPELMYLYDICDDYEGY